MMKHLWTSILLIISLTWASAQEINISNRLDTNSILIGQQTKLNVEALFPENQDIQLPIKKDSLNKDIEIVDISIDTLSSASGWNHFKVAYTITVFDSGYYAVPPQFLTQSGDTIAQSEALLLAVNTFQIDTTKQAIFDIKTPIEAPWTFSEFIEENYPYMLGFVLLVILIIALVWYLRKRKKQVPEEPQKVVIPKEAAHRIALRDLETLKEKKLWQNDRVKLYYIELSNIVRTYLENRFKVQAMEQTSAEILDTFQHAKHLTDNQITMLRQILNTADMAKFAKAKPMANENDLSLKNAFTLVEETKLMEQAENTKEVHHDA